MANDTKITEELKQEVVKLVAELLQQAFEEFRQQAKPVQAPEPPQAQAKEAWTTISMPTRKEVMDGRRELRDESRQELVTQRAEEKAEQRRQRLRDRGQTPHIDRFKEGVEERQYQPPATPPRREPKAAEPEVQLEPGLQPRSQVPVAPFVLPEIESVDAFNVVSYPQREKDQRTGNFENDTERLTGTLSRTTDATRDIMNAITTYLGRVGDHLRTNIRAVQEMDSEQMREVEA